VFRSGSFIIPRIIRQPFAASIRHGASSQQSNSCGNVAEALDLVAKTFALQDKHSEAAKIVLPASSGNGIRLAVHTGDFAAGADLGKMQKDEEEGQT